MLNHFDIATPFDGDGVDELMSRSTSEVPEGHLAATSQVGSKRNSLSDWYRPTASGGSSGNGQRVALNTIPEMPQASTLEPLSNRPHEGSLVVGPTRTYHPQTEIDADDTDGFEHEVRPAHTDSAAYNHQIVLQASQRLDLFLREARAGMDESESPEASDSDAESAGVAELGRREVSQVDFPLASEGPADDAIALRFPGLSLRQVDQSAFIKELQNGFGRLGVPAATVAALRITLREGSIIADLHGEASDLKEVAMCPLEQVSVMGSIAEVLPSPTQAAPSAAGVGEDASSGADAGAGPRRAPASEPGFFDAFWPILRKAETEAETESAAAVSSRAPASEPGFFDVFWPILRIYFCCNDASATRPRTGRRSGTVAGHLHLIPDASAVAKEGKRT